MAPTVRARRPSLSVCAFIMCFEVLFGLVENIDALENSDIMFCDTESILKNTIDFYVTLISLYAKTCYSVSFYA